MRKIKINYEEMTDYISEAEALSDIYDGEEITEPLSQEDKRDYVLAKSHCFKKSDIGKYVIVQKPRKKKRVINNLYLVNRKLTKKMWWSPSSFLAMVFESPLEAVTQAKKYKYNSVRVKKITPEMADIDFFESEYDETD